MTILLDPLTGKTSTADRDGGAAHKDPEFRNGMPFVGGRLWLDLVNTTPLDAKGDPIDLIATDEGLRTWMAAAQLQPDSEPEPGSLQVRFTALRADLRTAFESLHDGAGLAEASVAAINRLLDSVAIRVRLERDGTVLRLVEWIEPGRSGAAGRIADDFARFSCDFEPERLKHCANPGCSMVFYDTGKNNVRRWCSMSACGNRDKVARFRARKA
eukprot:gene30950-35228_t